MTKEEMLMQAIGMLPEEMAVQKETEELKKDARNLEKKEILYKSRYILATVAASLVLIITAASVNKNYGIKDKVNDAGINSSIPDKNAAYSNENKETRKENSINCFVIADTAGKKNIELCQEDNTKDIDSLPYKNLKKALQGRTVKLQAVEDTQSNSSSKKKAETEYIVFSFDQDCYLALSGFNKAGITYILDKESCQKNYIKGKEEFCKAGNYVYFDISGAKVKGSYKENIKNWDKKSIEVIAYADIYQKKDGNMEKTGVFYIGAKQKKKNNKERKIYYGRFEKES